MEVSWFKRSRLLISEDTLCSLTWSLSHTYQFDFPTFSHVTFEPRPQTIAPWPFERGEPCYWHLVISPILLQQPCLTTHWFICDSSNGVKGIFWVRDEPAQSGTGGPSGLLPGSDQQKWSVCGCLRGKRWCAGVHCIERIHDCTVQICTDPLFHNGGGGKGWGSGLPTLQESSWVSRPK